MAEHRVSMLSASLRRYEDPARSVDPRIRQLVTQLATLDAAPAPRAHFRAELRSQLVAVAPRLIADGPAIEARGAAPSAVSSTDAAATSSGRNRSSRARRAVKISVARPVAAITAVFAVGALLLGGAVLVSKRALPGDALYALKRANENVALSLAKGDVDKGRTYLRFAKTRAGEVSALLSRSSAMAAGPGATAAGAVNAHTAQLVVDTLDSADSDVRSGAQLLDSAAVRSGSAGPLEILTGWAPDQIARLNSIARRVAAGSLRNRVVASARLTAAALARAQALRAVLGCRCPDKMATDELGPVPCARCSAAQDPAPQRSAAPGAPAPRSSTVRGSTAVPPNATGGSGTARSVLPPIGSVPVPASTGRTGVTVPPAPPLPPLPLPRPTTLPFTLHTSAVPGVTTAGKTCTLIVLGVCLDP